MMTDFIVAPQGVQPHSYVAITAVIMFTPNSVTMMTLPSNAQHELILSVAKCGNPLEADDTKQNHCGKRDCEIMFMSLLQKVMFDKEDDDL